MTKTNFALITGAAHRIGWAIAEHLAGRGYAILLHYHRSRQEAMLAEEKLRDAGVPVQLVQADLRSSAGLQHITKEVDKLTAQRDWRLEILVNSAAVMKKTVSPDRLLDDWDETMDLNLRAAYGLASLLRPVFLEGGLIVNITDVAAQKLWTGYPAYVVSKSALETLTRLLAKSFAPHIRVNAIAPGLVLKAEDMPDEAWTRLLRSASYAAEVPLRDIAMALDFFLDNVSVTGQTIAVDRGYALT